jgi:2-polyprenyl-6-methoxyphenol hydroxylase-like FAD-dependent oxidoreductase
MNAAIIGCGIAGAVTALILKRANIDSAIFERWGRHDPASEQ